MPTDWERAFVERPEVLAAWADGLGVLPDASYRELDPELREALVVGRPSADS